MDFISTMDNNSSYEPFEPDRVTPVGRTPAAGQQPPGAPQREHPHMVAPGTGEPSPADQEQVSRRLWERLEYRPIAGASAGMRSAHAPYERMSGMCADTRSMWSHIGRGASQNLHPSPDHGEIGSSSQLLRQLNRTNRIPRKNCSKS